MTTLRVRYAPGQGVALVGERVVALLRSAPSDPFVDVLRPVVHAGGDVVDVVEALARAGVRALPALAVVAPAGDRLHVVLRGDLLVEARTGGPGGLHRLDAGGIETWLECPLIDGTVGMTLALPEATTSGAMMPADGAVLSTSRLDVELEPTRGAKRSRPTTSQRDHADGVTLTFPEQAEENALEPEPSYRHLFEATLQPSAPGELIDAIAWGAAADEPADHVSEIDERTVTRPPRQASADAGPSDRIGPMVHAIRCGAGHWNAPQSGACRRCGGTLAEQEPVTVPRPVLGVLRLSTGDVVSLDRDVVLGRGPRVASDVAERPHVVKVNNPSNDVSRNHVAVHLDGWHVLVEDLDSTNGTLVTLFGEEPQRLRARELVPILPGTEVHLADGISFCYEVEA